MSSHFQPTSPKDTHFRRDARTTNKKLNPRSLRNYGKGASHRAPLNSGARGSGGRGRGDHSSR